MIRQFLRFFAPPSFDNEDDNYRANFVNATSWLLIVIYGASLIPQLRKQTPDYTLFVLLGLVGVMVLTLLLLRWKYLRLSSILAVTLTWLGITLQAVTAEGVRDVIVVGYISVVLLSSIVISWRSAVIVIVASIGSIWMLTWLQEMSMIQPIAQSVDKFARDLTLIFIVLAFLIHFSTTNLRDAVRRANRSEEGLRSSNQELQELNQSLEERVSNRTAELEQANARNQKRAQQFAAIAQLARATAASMEMDELLPRLTDLISHQFGFYHAGIFLLDENRSYAVLKAANSEGGRRMLQRGHRLAFGQTGIVGFVAATGTPRIALDVGSDAVYFDNPDLPETRSELALPLRTSHEIIGVLDVQSMESNAFSAEDVEVLSTLADQVTIAIQNARSFEMTQKLLKDAQKTSGTYLQESWKVLQSQETNTGYLMMGNILKRLAQPVSSPQINRAISTRQTIAEAGEQPVLAVPIRLREQVIGIINIRLSEGHYLDPDEIDIAEAVSERLSLAIETALLLKTTRRRAEIERITSEISGRISSSTQFESILRTAAEELSRALGGSEVLVQLQTSETEASSLVRNS